MGSMGVFFSYLQLYNYTWKLKIVFYEIHCFLPCEYWPIEQIHVGFLAAYIDVVRKSFSLKYLE